MTDFNFTLNPKNIQELINETVQGDFAKNLLTDIFNQLMEKQRDEYLQVKQYQRDEKRKDYRNGYYKRSYTTRLGTLELNIPRTRDGKFSPDLFERYQRNEKALVSSMLEMYVNGVSTRKVSSIVETLCGKSISKSFVSSLTKKLDETVIPWQYSDISNNKYPYIITDVVYVKVREGKRVLSKGCNIAVGIDKYGKRNIIGYMIQDVESEDSWINFFEYLKERGLNGVKMIISDAHKGLIKAIRQSFAGCTWQRCQVHTMRNILSPLAKKDTEKFRKKIKSIFDIPDIDTARKLKEDTIKEYEEQVKYKKSCKILDEAFEDTFQYTVVGYGYSRLRSTNMVERLNSEIRRREKVIRIFPNEKSATRLIGAILMDINDQWVSSDRIYVNISE